MVSATELLRRLIELLSISFMRVKGKASTFKKFIERHMECYLELTRHSKPVNEAKKVRDFLA
jgi:hypothetical protein